MHETENSQDRTGKRTDLSGHGVKPLLRYLRRLPNDYDSLSGPNSLATTKNMSRVSGPSSYRGQARSRMSYSRVSSLRRQQPLAATGAGRVNLTRAASAADGRPSAEFEQSAEFIPANLVEQFGESARRNKFNNDLIIAFRSTQA